MVDGNVSLWILLCVLVIVALILAALLLTSVLGRIERKTIRGGRPKDHDRKDIENGGDAALNFPPDQEASQKAHHKLRVAINGSYNEYEKIKLSIPPADKTTTDGEYKFVWSNFSEMCDAMRGTRLNGDINNNIPWDIPNYRNNQSRKKHWEDNRDELVKKINTIKTAFMLNPTIVSFLDAALTAARDAAPDTKVQPYVPPLKLPTYPNTDTYSRIDFDTGKRKPHKTQVAPKASKLEELHNSLTDFINEYNTVIAQGSYIDVVGTLNNLLASYERLIVYYKKSPVGDYAIIKGAIDEKTKLNGEITKIDNKITNLITLLNINTSIDENLKTVLLKIYGKLETDLAAIKTLVEGLSWPHGDLVYPKFLARDVPSALKEVGDKITELRNAYNVCSKINVLRWDTIGPLEVKIETKVSKLIDLYKGKDAFVGRYELSSSYITDILQLISTLTNSLKNDPRYSVAIKPIDSNRPPNAAAQKLDAVVKTLPAVVKEIDLLLSAPDLQIVGRFNGIKGLSRINNDQIAKVNDIINKLVDKYNRCAKALYLDGSKIGPLVDNIRNIFYNIRNIYSASPTYANSQKLFNLRHALAKNINALNKAVRDTSGNINDGYLKIALDNGNILAIDFVIIVDELRNGGVNKLPLLKPSDYYIIYKIKYWAQQPQHIIDSITKVYNDLTKISTEYKNCIAQNLINWDVDKFSELTKSWNDLISLFNTQLKRHVSRDVINTKIKDKKTAFNLAVSEFKDQLDSDDIFKDALTANDVYSSAEKAVTELRVQYTTLYDNIQNLTGTILTGATDEHINTFKTKFADAISALQFVNGIGKTKLPTVLSLTIDEQTLNAINITNIIVSNKLTSINANQLNGLDDFKELHRKLDVAKTNMSHVKDLRIKLLNADLKFATKYANALHESIEPLVTSVSKLRPGAAEFPLKLPKLLNTSRLKILRGYSSSDLEDLTRYGEYRDIGHKCKSLIKKTRAGIKILKKLYFEDYMITSQSMIEMRKVETGILEFVLNCFKMAQTNDEQYAIDAEKWRPFIHTELATVIGTLSKESLLDDVNKSEITNAIDSIQKALIEVPPIRLADVPGIKNSGLVIYPPLPDSIRRIHYESPPTETISIVHEVSAEIAGSGVKSETDVVIQAASIDSLEVMVAQLPAVGPRLVYGLVVDRPGDMVALYKAVAICLKMRPPPEYATKVADRKNAATGWLYDIVRFESGSYYTRLHAYIKPEDYAVDI